MSEFGESIGQYYEDKKIDDEGVNNFSEAMKDKLTKKRIQGRRGWNDPKLCRIDILYQLLEEHMDKLSTNALKNEDLVDIGNFAMMIWNRNNASRAMKGE